MPCKCRGTHGQTDITQGRRAGESRERIWLMAQITYTHHPRSGKKPYCPTVQFCPYCCGMVFRSQSSNCSECLTGLFQAWIVNHPQSMESSLSQLSIVANPSKRRCPILMPLAGRSIFQARQKQSRHLPRTTCRLDSARRGIRLYWHQKGAQYSVPRRVLKLPSVQDRRAGQGSVGIVRESERARGLMRR